MSTSDRTSAAKTFEMPEEFSFGLEERSTASKAIDLDLSDSSGCNHQWFKRESPYQTLRHEGKTVLECRMCKRTAVVHDWKIES